MSTSGRYQSRLFSFFSQQSLRLKDKTSQAWRQVKLATVWSTQIALYPIYALFQSGRLLGRQMGQASRQIFPRLRAVKRTVKQQILNPSEPNPSESFALFADTPIHHILAERRGEGLAIQGFASLLTNRGLVLVTAENETLDVLTGEQQMQLQQQMMWEMVNYWRYRKIQPPLTEQTHLQGWTNTFLPLPKERANLLPPIRAFRHLMAWIQLSPVAIAVNLFQESRLVALPSATDIGLEPKSEPEGFSLASPTLPQRLPPKPWLKIEDFFGGEFIGATGSGQIVKRTEAAVQRTGAREAIADGYLEAIAPFGSAELMMRSPSTSAIDQPAKDEGGIAATILEAEVTGVSYEKHPLEQLLKWLDLGMLWVEQKSGQVWSWLHRS